MTRPCRLLLSCAGLLLFPLIVHAQTSPPARKTSSASPKQTAAKSPNVKMGEIVSLDATTEMLIFKEKNGQQDTVSLTPKTRYLKNRRLMTAADFKSGEAAVLHIRRSRSDDSAKALELTDPASWAWLVQMRKTTVSATLTELGDETLTAAVGEEKIPVVYTISEKTRWAKNGKEGSVTDFKSGETVYIVPRSLPSGNIMARVVADTPGGAATMKERGATTIHGVVETLEADKHQFTLTTQAGDKRTFLLNDTTEFKLGTKTLPLTALHSGLHVAVRVKHDVMGEDVAARIKIETATKAKKVPARAPATGTRR